MLEPSGQIGDRGGIGSRRALVASIPRELPRRTGVTTNKVLVKMRHASSHHHCECEFRSNLLTQRSCQPDSKTSECSSFLVGEISKVGGMAVAFDKEVPERCSAVIARRRVIDPEAIEHGNTFATQRPFAAVFRADDALRHYRGRYFGSSSSSRAYAVVRF